MSNRSEGRDVAALISGGVDSAVLGIELLNHYDRIFPIYVRFGLRWEDAELNSLRNYLAAVERPGLMPLNVIIEPIADVYGDHWSIEGPGVPEAAAPDEAVYLPGRTLLLVAKAAVWCTIRGVTSLALGTLGSNPFSDSTPEFDRDLEAVLRQATRRQFRLIRPFAKMKKVDVLNLGAHLPLWLTFSCLEPIDGRHCGLCNKCGERRRAFLDQALVDRTVYNSDLLSARTGWSVLADDGGRAKCIE